jgi:predicted nucleic acid-binding protein
VERNTGLCTRGTRREKVNILLDTSTVISFFLEDIHTEKVRSIFMKIFSGEYTAHIPQLVFVETCGAICRRTDIETPNIVYGKVTE